MRTRRFNKPLALAGMLTVLQLMVACGGNGDPAGPTETAVPETAAPDGTATAPTNSPATSTATSSPVTSTPALGRELLLDGSFELTPYEHWMPRLQQGQRIEIVEDRTASGNSALYMTTPSSSESWPWLILRNRFPAEAGQGLRVGYRAIQTEQRPVQVLIDFYSGNGEFIGRNAAGIFADSEDQWLEHFDIFTAPEGSATALINIQLRIREQGPGETLEAWVDDVSVRQVIE